MHGVLRTPVRWLPWWCTAGALLEIGTLDGLWLGATVGLLGSIESRESPWAVNSAVEEALGPGSRESLRWGTRGTSTARETRSRVDRVDRARSPTADEAALRRLWDEHAGALLGFVLRLTGGDRGRAEDVVQETLLQAWRHPEALDPARGSARPWLLTVARRLGIDQWRGRPGRARRGGGGKP